MICVPLANGYRKLVRLNRCYLVVVVRGGTARLEKRSDGPKSVLVGALVVLFLVPPSQDMQSQPQVERLDLIGKAQARLKNIGTCLEHTPVGQKNIGLLSYRPDDIPPRVYRRESSNERAIHSRL
jgi:hypothetical protein